MSEQKPSGAIKKKRDHKKNRKDNFSWENVMKELEQVTEDEKWNILESKYKELHENFLTSYESLQVCQKQKTDLDSEKSQLNRELAKVVLSKTKMESLARELQKQNKEIKVSQ